MYENVLAFDLETAKFASGCKAPPIACLTWARVVDGVIVKGIIPGHEAERFILPYLERCVNDAEPFYIVGHHIGYDMACLMEHGSFYLRCLIFQAYKKSRIRDTEMRERLIDIATDRLKGYADDDGDWIKKDYNLEDLAYAILGKTLDKGDDGWRLRYGELIGIPLNMWPERATAYALEDAVVTLEIFINQEERLGADTLPTEYLEARGDLSFVLASDWGMMTDGDRVDLLWRWTNKRMRALMTDLIETPLYVRKGSKKRLAEIAPDDFETLGTKRDLKYLRALIERSWNTERFGPIPMSDGGKKGVPQIQYGGEVLDMIDDQHPELTLLVEYERLQKSGSTYVRKLFDGILHPIHAGYHSLGAKTSRASSFKPNLQNQPRLPGVRECWMARAGRSYVACDFTTQEMRALAQSCLDIVGWSTLAERFQTDPHFDAHLELAANQLLKIPLEEARRRKKAGDSIVEDARQDAKIINFGIPGGMREKGIVRFAKKSGRSIDRDTASLWIAAYEQERPEMVELFKYAKSLVGRNRDGVSIGTQSGFVRAGCGFTDWCNNQFQAPSAHASKEAFFESCYRMYCVETSWLFGSRPVNCVHDEIMVECFEGYEHEVALELEELMSSEMRRVATPDIPTAAEAVAMKHWSKKAKPIFENGRLVPWTGKYPITQEMVAA